MIGIPTGIIWRYLENTSKGLFLGHILSARLTKLTCFWSNPLQLQQTISVFSNASVAKFHLLIQLFAHYQWRLIITCELISQNDTKSNIKSYHTFDSGAL